MASQEPPLDEIQWRSQEEAMSMQGVHDNSILFYFAASPFFDPTSNNAVLFSQAMYNERMTSVIGTRQAFEARLKTMSGLEFMVAQEPAEMAPGTGTGVWVIRKQTRRKRLGEEDEINVLSSYFVVGENIYMAPAVSDVLSGRMLSMLTSLSKFYSTAAALPDFSPALGHTYLPPPSRKAPESQLSQLSKEDTPLPDALQTSKKPLTSTNTSTFLSNRLLEETINITIKYGDEYMDDNPITGQPGAFNLSTTGRKEKNKLMPPVAAKGPMAVPKQASTPPLAVKTDIQPPSRKGSKVEKSPRTPGMPKPKRRKSKALSAGGISPT